jgi:hypothetical protein
MKKDISKAFISYSHKDKPFVSKLVGDLASMGANVWVDLVEMKVGDSIVRKIQDGIEESEWLIIVLSPDSVESKWVKTELSAALVNELEKDKVFILPLLYRVCKIPLLLRDKVYADFTSSYDEGLKALVDRITPDIDPKIFKGILSDEYSLIQRSWNKVSDIDKDKYIRLVKQKLFSEVNSEKRAAMTALYIIDKNLLRNQLIALASDSGTSVVRNALFYIGELGMREAISIVSQKMSDGTPHIRAAARDAYRKIT